MISPPEVGSRSLPRSFCAALILVPLAMLVLLENVGRAPAIDGRWRHDGAWAQFSDSPTPPAARGGEFVALPDLNRPAGSLITST